MNYTWAFLYEGVEDKFYGPTPTFRFQKAGICRVTLNVSDAAGNWDTDTAVVVVTALAGAHRGLGDIRVLVDTAHIRGRASRPGIARCEAQAQEGFERAAVPARTTRC